MYITDDNDIYSYFYVINNIKPARVIDIGMLLMRAGAVAREAKGESLNVDMRLDAVNSMEIPSLAVYDNVYDTIYAACFENVQEKYDLAMVYRAEEIMSNEQIDKMLNWCKEHVNYLFMDCRIDGACRKLIAMGTVKEIQISESKYLLVSMIS